MAKLQEEIIVLKFSKLIRDNGEVVSIVNSEVLATLEQVASELTSALIEIEQVKGADE